MKSLVICEKRSQAEAVKRAIGTRYGPVLPARGHIIRLVEPQEYNAAWKTWSAGMVWPGQFYPKTVIQETKHLLQAIEQAARGADQVIVSTDPDREGTLIGMEVVEYIKFKGVVLRANFVAEDPVSIQSAFQNLTPISQHRNQYEAGKAREQADQTANLSLTRTATVTLQKPGRKGAIGVGRVKTPVLSMICERALEIQNFKPREFYSVRASLGVQAGSVDLTCRKLPNSSEEPEADDTNDVNEGEDALAAEETLADKILDKDLAHRLAETARGSRGPISVIQKTGKQKPPKLFDLTGLQAAASSAFGWSGEKTLEVAQKLYSDIQVITYPRAEAVHLPEAAIADAPELVRCLVRLKKFTEYQELMVKPVVRKGKAGHFCDKALEGCSHYAIIPNINTRDTWSERLRKVGPDEHNLFEMIARRYLAALAPDFEFKSTKLVYELPFEGQLWTFDASGRVPIRLGWRSILRSTKKSDDAEILVPVTNGEIGTVADTEVKESFTKPPGRYTDGALIRAMKECWRLAPTRTAEERDLRERLKDVTGIGTPATRGTVVKGLIDQRQIVKKGKYLEPTPGGMALYAALKEAGTTVTSPVTTARWETLWSSIERGEMGAFEAVERIVRAVSKEVDAISRLNLQIDVGGIQKPTKGMTAMAEKVAKEKGIPLPKGAKSDGTICKAFLDEHLGGQPARPDGDVTPTEKQLKFAREISSVLKVPVPEGAVNNYRELSKWIDTHRKKMPKKPPSEKQITFARTLAGEAGIEVPQNAQTCVKACSAFISQTMKKGRAKKPARRA